MDIAIPQWLIDVTKSVGAGSAPVLAVVSWFLWKENGRLKERLFERLDKTEPVLDKLAESMGTITGFVANDLQTRLSDHRLKSRG